LVHDICGAQYGCKRRGFVEDALYVGSAIGENDVIAAASNNVVSLATPSCISLVLLNPKILWLERDGNIVWSGICIDALSYDLRGPVC
jgi:hypothetical protein